MDPTMRLPLTLFKKHKRGLIVPDLVGWIPSESIATWQSSIPSSISIN
jgi:hypothetical protein